MYVVQSIKELKKHLTSINKNCRIPLKLRK